MYNYCFSETFQPRGDTFAAISFLRFLIFSWASFGICLYKPVFLRKESLKIIKILYSAICSYRFFNVWNVGIRFFAKNVKKEFSRKIVLCHGDLSCQRVFMVSGWSHYKLECDLMQHTPHSLGMLLLHFYLFSCLQLHLDV